VTRQPPPGSGPGTGPATPSGPSGYLVAALALLVLAPLALVTWLAGAAALRAERRVRRWHLAAIGGPGAALAGWLVLPGVGHQAALAVSGVVMGHPGGALRPSWGLLGAAAGLFCRWALLTAPVGVPAGLVAAAVPPVDRGVPRPEWQASERRARERAETARRRRAVKRAGREGSDPGSPALAVSLGGDLAGWRIGDLIVPPAGQLGLAWLLIGAPGVGKSTAQHRLAYLAGRERRHRSPSEASQRAKRRTARCRAWAVAGSAPWSSRSAVKAATRFRSSTAGWPCSSHQARYAFTPVRYMRRVDGLLRSARKCTSQEPSRSARSSGAGMAVS